MKRILISPLFLIIFFSCAETEKITFVEYKKNEGKKDLKKIMIIGAGSTDTRFFLDMLANKLTKDFKKIKIKTEYNYIGKINKNSSINIKPILNKGYDAFIIFNPKDTSKIKIDTYQNNNSVYLPSLSDNRINYQTNTRTILYKQAFEISMYISNDAINSLWEASLRVTIDYTNDKNYARISKKILTNLKENNLIN
jgi:hypothetical protein